MSDDSSQSTYQGSFVRFVVLHYLFGFLILAAAWVVFTLAGSSYGHITLPLTSVGWLVGAFIYAWRKRDVHRIVFVEGQIIGPSRLDEERVTIPLEEIDRSRTEDRTLWQRLTGTYRIWSTDGRYITVAGEAFSSDIRSEILVKAGLIG